MALSLQSEAQARQDTGMTSDEWVETHDTGLAALAGSGRFPALAYVGTQRFGFDLPAVFESGLHLLLDGVEMKVRAMAR
jgi:Tetracyclin repressor-like, C-terminal domain